MFNDKNLRNLTETGAQDLIRDLGAFLENFFSPDEVHPNFKDVAKSVLSTARGIVGIASPVPQKCGCTLEDTVDGIY